jgi:hypothetical protein
LASKPFSEDDYIRDHKEFRRVWQQGGGNAET